MSPAVLVEQQPVRQEPVDGELTLLIREARIRQRRRQINRALGGLVIAAGAGLIALLAAGDVWPTADAARSGRPASLAAGACPASPARFVSNSAYAATVLGQGRIRLAIGNVYLKRIRRVVLGTTSSPGWSGIEAIWVREPGIPGTLTVHGMRLGKPGAAANPGATANPGAIAVASSNAGPGRDVLPLPPGAANTAPGGVQLYPAVIWVRSGGCYSLNVRGRGLSERIVLDAQRR